jgi:sugar lactone lactonase YvrE
MERSNTEILLAVSAGVAVGYALAHGLKSARENTFTKGRVSLVWNAKRISLGEGPIWDSEQQRLLWIDITKSKIHIFKDGSNRTVDLRQMPGTIVPRAGHPDQAVVAMHRGVGIVSLADGKVVKWFGNPPDEVQRFNNRFNDGKCDPAGRLWAGTMDLRCEGDNGALYCMKKDGSFYKAVSNAKCPNGIVWSKDKSTMYWIDTTSMPLRIDAFDYDDATGEVSNRRKAVDMSSRGYPDGCTIDDQDRIYVAKWGGFCIECYDAKANKLIDTYDIPVAQVTACAFGGPNLDQLYVTTASCGLSDEEDAAQPLAGGLFMIDLAGTGIRGVPATPFRG